MPGDGDVVFRPGDGAGLHQAGEDAAFEIDERTPQDVAQGIAGGDLGAGATGLRICLEGARALVAAVGDQRVEHVLHAADDGRAALEGGERGNGGDERGGVARAFEQERLLCPRGETQFVGGEVAQLRFAAQFADRHLEAQQRAQGIFHLACKCRCCSGLLSGAPGIGLALGCGGFGARGHGEAAVSKRAHPLMPVTMSGARASMVPISLMLWLTGSTAAPTRSTRPL
jgi:hypothetical protein